MCVEKTEYSLDELLSENKEVCSCGKSHIAGINVLIEKNALERLPELTEANSAKKIFLLSGKASFKSVGERLCDVLEKHNISYTKYVFPTSPVVPDETAVGSALMHFDYDCDLIVAVGSGVINDIAKIISKATGRRFIIVATAPSMDGYASSSSSMELDGVKVSLNSTSAWAIVGDLDVLCSAPLRLLQAGVGDMLAKYISLCEWKISNIINDEYYCPYVEEIVRQALNRCVEMAPELLSRKTEAVKTVMEGMIIAGLAMKYAGVSRPASGMEHYFSHIWDMRAVAFGTPTELHGIQCGASTLLSLRVYEYIKHIVPDREKALRYAAHFSVEEWNSRLLEFIGPGALKMIERENLEGKYDRLKHAERLERIISKWDSIQAQINKLPAFDDVAKILDVIGAPKSPIEFGISQNEIKTSFLMTKDIRDKYIASRLLWDLGILEEAADALF